MSKTEHILSVVHYTICGAVCFQFTNFPCYDWENIYIYTLSYYHHQIGSMNYYPFFRLRSWKNGVRCMSFCIRMILMVVWNAKWLCHRHVMWWVVKPGFIYVPKWTVEHPFTQLCRRWIIPKGLGKPWLLISWLLASSCHEQPRHHYIYREQVGLCLQYGGC